VTAPTPTVKPTPVGQGTGPARVAAVVLTHRRPRLASQVVRNLLYAEQVPAARVVVVVNGEGGLDDPALEAAVRVLRLADNLGPAGGFRAGLAEACRDPDIAWVYLCEDDVGLFALPSPRVAELVARAEALADPALGAVVAYGRDHRGPFGHTVAHRVTGADGFEPVDAAAWGASLIARRVVDAGVLPDPDYFFGYEDFDFFYQLRAAGFRLLVDRSAAISAAGRESISGRAEAFAGERPTDAEEPWRAFYTARNYFRLASRHGTPLWTLGHLAYSARRLQLALSGAERAAILRGLVAGVTGGTGRDSRFVRTLGEQTRANKAAPAGDSSERAPGAAQGDRRVLHVLPADTARGAQVFARDLRAALDRPGERHLLLTVFAGGDAVLDPDVRLDVTAGRLRAAGLEPRGLRRMRAELARIRPDVVVAHGGEPLKYLAPLADSRFALVYYAIGTVTPAARTGWRRTLYQWLLGRCDAVAGVSAETLEEAGVLFGVPEWRRVLLPNGRDPTVFHPHANPGRGTAEVTLVFVGHLTATKRPDWFVSVVGELRRRGLPVRGVVVGDGPLEADLRAAAADGVTMLGRRLDVADILRASDILVLPSSPESEGMPGVLIEAGLSALPVVATRVPGATAVVEDGHTGLLVDHDDLPALIDATARLAGDAELRQRMGVAARTRCEQHFSDRAAHEGWRALLACLAPPAPG